MRDGKQYAMTQFNKDRRDLHMSLGEIVSDEAQSRTLRDLMDTALLTWPGQRVALIGDIVSHAYALGQRSRCKS